MEVAKERLALARCRSGPEQVRIERIGQLACGARGIECVGRAIERRAMLPNEVLPGAFVAGRARAGERQILEVQGREVPLDLPGVARRLAERFRGACRKRRRKIGQRSALAFW
jgi:hypothetical protein